MLGFIYKHQFLTGVIVFVLFLFVVYLFVKAVPAKVNKKETKTEAKKEQKIEDIEKPDGAEVKEDEEKPKSKEKTITQIYKRELPEEVKEQLLKDEDKYDRTAEFVNTSKNVSKFKGYIDKVDANSETKTDEYGYVTEVKDDCEFCETNVKHFDHSRRLSNMVKNNNFDDMFASHISDKYLNLNVDRHLNVGDEFDEKLMSRTNKMLDASGSKISSVEDQRREMMSDIILSDNGYVPESQTGADDVKIDTKTILVVDSIMHRKKKK